MSLWQLSTKIQKVFRYQGTSRTAVICPWWPHQEKEKAKQWAPLIVKGQSTWKHWYTMISWAYDIVIQRDTHWYANVISFKNDRTDRLSAKRSVRFYDGLWVVAWWNLWVFALFLVSILHFGVGFTIQTEDFCGFASAKRSIGSNINGWKWVNFWIVFRFATANTQAFTNLFFTPAFAASSPSRLTHLCCDEHSAIAMLEYMSWSWGGGWTNYQAAFTCMPSSMHLLFQCGLKLLHGHAEDDALFS